MAAPYDIHGDLPAPEAALAAAVQETVARTAAQLDRSHRDFLAGLPVALAFDVPGVSGHAVLPRRAAATTGL